MVSKRSITVGTAEGGAGGFKARHSTAAYMYPASGMLLIASLLLASCSSKSSEEERLPTFPVSGKLTVLGKPAPGALIAFHPKKADPKLRRLPTAQVGKDGSFTVNTYTKDDGAPVGDYAVTVQWTPLIVKDGEARPGPNVVPPNYGNRQSTTLTARVTEGTNHLPPINIVR